MNGCADENRLQHQPNLTVPAPWGPALMRGALANTATGDPVCGHVTV